MAKYKVWTCKIVVPGDADLPVAFDAPPREAATEAVRASGIDVIGCFSGWGGRVTITESAVLEDRDLTDEEIASLEANRPHVPFLDGEEA